MARHRSVLDLRRPLADEDLVLDAADALWSRAVAWHARTSASAEVSCELAAKRASRLDVQRQVNRLVRHPHLQLVRVLGLEPRRDLLRRPVCGELRFHGATQRAMHRELGALRAQRPPPGGGVGPLRSVRPPAAVAPDFTRDRRGRPSKPYRDRTTGQSRREPSRDLLALACTQLVAAPPTLVRPDTAVHARHVPSYDLVAPSEVPSDR